MELSALTKNKKVFCEETRGILREKAVVPDLEPKFTLEIRDPDCLTVKEQVEEALKRDLPDLGEVKLGLPPENLGDSESPLWTFGTKNQGNSS